jgi:hypothetical protein
VNGQHRGSDDKFSGTEQRYGNRRASGLEVTVGSDQPQSVLLDGRTEHQIEHRRELFDQSGGRKGGRGKKAKRGDAVDPNRSTLRRSTETRRLVSFFQPVALIRGRQ